MSADTPTQTEIEFRLMMLNRLERDWADTEASARTQIQGLKNSKKWFESNHIKITQKRAGGKWEIEPKEEGE